MKGSRNSHLRWQNRPVPNEKKILSLSLERFSKCLEIIKNKQELLLLLLSWYFENMGDDKYFILPTNVWEVCERYVYILML